MPLLALDQLERHSGKCRRLLGTWDGNWKRGRPEGPETVVLEELFEGKFEETDKTGQNQGDTIFMGWVEKTSTRKDRGRKEENRERGHMKPRGSWWSRAPVTNSAIVLLLGTWRVVLPGPRGEHSSGP